MNYTHILPIDDLMPHIQSKHCMCKPSIEKINNTESIVIHNAYDGRDRQESYINNLKID